MGVMFINSLTIKYFEIDKAVKKCQIEAETDYYFLKFNLIIY